MEPVVGAADDVAADEVGVVGLQIGGAPADGGDDAVAESGREALDLVSDDLGGIAGVAERHVGVGVDRVDIARRARRVGQVLLPKDDERPPVHPTLRPLAFAVCDLGECPAQVHGAGVTAVGIGPGMWPSMA